jgi:hypothetical protein
MYGVRTPQGVGPVVVLIVLTGSVSNAAMWQGVPRPKSRCSFPHEPVGPH